MFHSFNPRPFLYELMWSSAKGLNELVSQWWDSVSPVGCGAFVMAKKVSALWDNLRRWAKFSFGSIKLQKLDLLQEIEKVDVLKESRRLDPQEAWQEQVIREKIGGDILEAEISFAVVERGR